MNLMRIIILVAAIAAAGLTAILVSSLVSAPDVATDEAVKIPVTRVLVAARKIEIGAKLTEADLRWQEFPEPSVASTYFTQDRNPDAIKEHVGGIARSEIFSDSPIVPGKIVNAGDGGFMSAILEGGMRAMSVQVSPETGAGGFILPGDRVDVILSRESKVEDESGNSGQEIVSETVLENVRILAIDQTVNDPAAASGGEVKTSSVIGKTATLELTPAQAQTLSKAVASGGSLVLVLRSLERKEDPDFAAREAEAAAALEAERSKNKSFTIIRYGTPGKFRPK